MRPDDGVVERLTRYLLGQMAPEDQERLEDEYAADPDLHDELQATERDLIDRYVRGELPESKAFEASFLASPSRRQKVEFARALMHSFNGARPVAGETPERAGWRAWRGTSDMSLRWSLAAAMMILLVAGWLAWNRDGGSAPAQVAERPPAAPSRAEDLPPDSAPTAAAEPVQPTPAPRPPAIATFMLTPTLTRSAADTRTLEVNASADVQLELGFEGGDYDRYQAVLRTPEGEEVARTSRLTPSRGPTGDTVVMAVPAGAVRTRDYIVILSGMTTTGEVEEVASYFFRVQTR